MPKPQATPDAAALRERKAVARRGDRLQLHLARVELVIGDLGDIDRLLVLNSALRNVLDDAAKRDAGRHP